MIRYHLTSFLKSISWSIRVPSKCSRHSWYSDIGRHRSWPLLIREFSLFFFFIFFFKSRSFVERITLVMVQLPPSSTQRAHAFSSWKFEKRIDIWVLSTVIRSLSKKRKKGKNTTFFFFFQVTRSFVSNEKCSMRFDGKSFLRFVLERGSLVVTILQC